MKFSGHETFHVREGWLTKGMQLLYEDSEAFNNKTGFMHDRLGVGSNMDKSIKHWLLSTGLSEPVPKQRGVVQLSQLGQIVLQKDPYLLDTFSWWILHINLLHGKETSTSWHWFFNNFFQSRFDRKACVEALRRYLQFKQSILPSYQTLDRDIGCLLSGYSRSIPENVSDPEENYDSPFTDLGLLLHFRETGAYQLSYDKKSIPACALGYCLSKAFEVEKNTDVNVVTVYEAALRESGPGKCFLLAASDIFELVEGYGDKHESGISVTGLAGNRVIEFAVRSPLDWVDLHFKGVKQGWELV